MLRNNEYYDFQAVLDNLYAESCNGRCFRNLMELIRKEENILLAYRNIKKNKGSHTKGVDGKTITYLSGLHPEELVTMVRNKLDNYFPQRVRRDSYHQGQIGAAMHPASSGASLRGKVL